MHPSRLDAQNFMRNLGERRLHALTVRMHTDAQFQSAIRRQPRHGLLVTGHHRNAPARIDRSAVRRLLAIDREADADPAAVRFA